MTKLTLLRMRGMDKGALLGIIVELQDQVRKLTPLSVEVIDTERGRHILAQRDKKSRGVTTVWLQISDLMPVGAAREMLDYEVKKLRSFLIRETFSPSAPRNAQETPE